MTHYFSGDLVEEKEMQIDEMKVGEVKELLSMIGGKKKAAPKVIDGGIRIVVLQRGWVLVGRYKQVSQDCELTNASVIRVWGTSKGLGEIAMNGPVSGKTVLDPCTTAKFHELTICFTLECSEEKWAKHIL